MTWTPPKTDQLTAAFSYDSGTLTPIDGVTPDNDAQRRAAHSYSVWQAACAMPDASMMILKTDDTLSLALAPGGLIVEGRAKLNLGLIRASAKALPPVAPGNIEPHVPQASRFRTTFWQVFERLAATELPRHLVVSIGPAQYSIHAKAGALTFAGDATNPADFVAKIEAAAEAEEAVNLTLADADSPPAGVTHHPIDLITAICEPASEGSIEFDPDGWPLSCAPNISADSVLALSTLAVQICTADAARSALTLSVLSSTNQPLVRGSITADGTVVFTLG